MGLPAASAVAAEEMTSLGPQISLSAEENRLRCEQLRIHSYPDYAIAVASGPELLNAHRGIRFRSTAIDDRISSQSNGGYKMRLKLALNNTTPRAGLEDCHEGFRDSGRSFLLCPACCW